MSKEGRQVFGLIEYDRGRAMFIGWIVGSHHVEFEGHTVCDVDRKLREATASLIANNELILDTEFAAVVCLHQATGARSST